MRWNLRTAAPVAVLGVAALALTGCGSGDPAGDVEAIEVPTEPAAGSTADSPAAGETADTSTDPSTAGAEAPDGTASAAAGDAGAVAGLPPRPERDRCVDVPEATDGVYTVYEAGTATVTVADGRLTLVQVQAADGWTSRVDDEDADGVEIDFRQDGATDVLDLEVEVENGRVEVQICNDDD